ncbi:MAG: FHA domain-containing protein [Planctomycetaceae bacterium]|nr:FHA domain-containing protein [Planctomycetaceae bacterium]
MADAGADGMAWQLVPVADDRQAVPIDKAVLFFGRHPECDVVITTSRKVSRKHCCLAQVNNALIVRDLGSMNGVRVNGKTIRRESPLKLGDTLSVGDVEFELMDGRANVGRPALPQQLGNGKRPPKNMLSQSVPVIIPEEDHSFSVEKSVNKRPPSSAPIELDSSDIIE